MNGNCYDFYPKEERKFIQELQIDTPNQFQLTQQNNFLNEISNKGKNN